MPSSTYDRFDSARLRTRADSASRLLAGFSVLVSSTALAGSPLAGAALPDRPLPSEQWPGSDFTSEDNGALLRFQLIDDGTSLTTAGIEIPSTQPAHTLQSGAAWDETSEADQVWGESAVEALSGLEEYSEEDWDMEEASPITPELLKLAASLLQYVPQSAALPDVAPAADGTVCMEWVAPSGLLWVDIGPDRTAWMLTRIDGKREEKRLPVDGKDFWFHFRTALEMLYPPKSVEDFWAFFEAA